MWLLSVSPLDSISMMAETQYLALLTITQFNSVSGIGEEHYETNEQIRFCPNKISRFQFMIFTCDIQLCSLPFQWFPDWAWTHKSRSFFTPNEALSTEIQRRAWNSTNINYFQLPWENLKLPHW